MKTPTNRLFDHVTTNWSDILLESRNDRAATYTVAQSGLKIPLWLNTTEESEAGVILVDITIPFTHPESEPMDFTIHGVGPLETICMQLSKNVSFGTLTVRNTLQDRLEIHLRRLVVVNTYFWSEGTESFDYELTQLIAERTALHSVMTAVASGDITSAADAEEAFVLANSGTTER
jgi:hypothetical protein